MEEEPKVNFISKALVWIKSHIAITVAIAVALIVVIVLICVFAGGGPKSAVKGFISGMNKKKAAKVVDNMDFAGSSAWSYTYDIDDFSEDDYDEFIDKYEDVDKDEIKEQEESLESTLEDGFDALDDEYKSYKFKIEEFKSSEKIAKDLYVVEAKIALSAKPEDEDTDEIDESDIITFIVYKDRIINSDIFYAF